MASNSFGKHFRITTWGESHGPAIGVVIDGCPSGLSLDVADIQQALDKRRPGSDTGDNPYISPRKESDEVEILSGVFEGKTTGSPISLLIRNRNARPEDYEPLKHLYRPGHADYTWEKKYGFRDWRGGGRASARETAVRVAAGAVARKLLSDVGIRVFAYLKELGGLGGELPLSDAMRVEKSPFFTDVTREALFRERLRQVKEEGDSVGGVIECHVLGCPPGVGDPVFEKLPAKLAEGALSIPAAKGFEMGEGFHAAHLKGSQMNDALEARGGTVSFKTNHSGGVLGGISNGDAIVFRVAFKPASSILKPQETLDVENRSLSFELPPGARHDTAPVIRAVPVVEAMACLVVLDLLFQKEMNPCRVS